MYREILESSPLQGRTIPQKGDRSIVVSQQQITADFQQAGIDKGDIIMLHSSLSSMGNVIGGADSAVGGILDAVGKQGTLCVPSFWWTPADPPYQFNQFNVDESPGFNGVISETVRKYPGACRSNNPSHSVAAVGAAAAEITATHGTYGWRPGPYGVAAFAEDSPWTRLYQYNAWYGFLGVWMSVNTMAHYAEHLIFMELYEKAKSKDKEMMLNYLCKPFYPQQGWWPSFSFLKMGERLEEENLVQKRQVGSAELRIIRSREMVDRILEILHSEPKKWLISENAKPFLRWL
jgi:aminoglycoside 3-N-acetyltransferase